MGCICSADAEEKKINADLKKDKETDKYVKKLLFLGSGGSGKSTLFKQLRTIHGPGYLKEDRMTFIDHIHAQIIEQMKLAIEGLEILAEEQPAEYKGVDGLSDTAKQAVVLVNDIKDPKLTAELAEAIKTLWNEQGIQQIYDMRATTKIEDSSAYFWDGIDRIMKSDYVPDERDILLVRYRTTGVIDQRFTIKKNTFHIFDVGGQKSERKKWIHCFESVTAVIFVASLSCYDEVMFEDEGVNSMSDSLELFEKICNNEWFVNTSMILFLNKKDLFAEKIQNKPITVCDDLKEYTGEQKDFESSTEFIKNAFFLKNNNPEKSIFAHLTCATDQDNVEKVFNDVQHIIIENSLMSAGLMGDFGGSESEVHSNNYNDDQKVNLTSNV